MSPLAKAASSLVGAAWELRRRGYAAGWLKGRRVAARVVSIGNLTVGGTGKTTFALHLARRARELGWNSAVVCRDYRPGPSGRGDEALLFEAALGAAHVFSGTSKADLAERAARAGHDLILVDDGFSHWALERNLDLVLIDARDPWGGGALLPAGRMREPRRALQRAGVLVISRARDRAEADRLLAEVRPYAPAAALAAGRHRVVGIRGPNGSVTAGGPARVVTATGNPEAVAASAREAGFDPVTLSAYRDHHWFSEGEARREREAARDATLVVTAKDAVRWPLGVGGHVVLEVAWEWLVGGEQAERLALEKESR